MSLLLRSRLRSIGAQTRFNSTQASKPHAPPSQPIDMPVTSTVPPRSTHASYHPKGYGVSEGLKRARRPYRLQNIVTGAVIMGFATSVYFYSISKVKQDDFSDLADIRAPAAGAAASPITTENDHQHKV